MKKRILVLILTIIFVSSLFSTALAADETIQESPAPQATEEPQTTEAPVPTPEPTAMPESASQAIPEFTPEPLVEPLPEPTIEPIIQPEEIQPAGINDALDTTSGDYDYVVNTDGVSATITKYHGAGGEVTIPGTIEGHAVTNIWYMALYDCDTITKVVIPEGVQSIMDKAFERCSNLETVSLANSITTIGAEAFADCAKLKNISLPTGIKDLSDYMFCNCISLENIILPSELTRIGKGAFGSSGLTGISIPGSVTVIDDNAFSSCSKLIGVIIPGTVKNIGANAFNSCQYITSITLGNGITDIGDGTFSHCIKLATITIPASVASIGQTAFDDCYILNSINVDEGNGFFSSRDGVLFNEAQTQIIRYPEAKAGTSYNIPDGVVDVGVHAFFCCSKTITGITIPGSVKTIGAEAFYGAGLTDVSIPDNVVSIGENAFVGPKLTAINVSSGNAFYQGIDGVLFDKARTSILQYPSGKTATSYSIPSVQHIGPCAFNECSYLKKITVPGGVIDVGNYAFADCWSLTDIELPDSIETIGEQAFAACYALCGIDLPEKLDSVERCMFNGCISLKSINLPANLSYIGEQAFGNCLEMTTIQIPATVKNIDGYAFYACSKLSKIYFYGNAPSVGYYTFGQCASGLTIYYRNDKTGFTNPWQGCTTVACDPASMPPFGSSGHAGKSGDYGYWAEGGYAAITEYTGGGGAVNIPSSLDGYPVTAINSYVFKENSSVTSVNIPQGVKSIGAQAFINCANLKSISIPDGVTKIGIQAFCGCIQLRGIRLPNGLTRVEDETFYYCPVLGYAILPDSLTSIGVHAFGSCGLQSIMIPENVTNIGSSAFSQCSLNRAYFKGNAPTMGYVDFPVIDNPPVFAGYVPGFTVCYISGKTGFTNPWYGYPTAVYDPNAVFKVSFSSGMGGEAPPYYVEYGAVLSEPAPPAVQGCYFVGWYLDVSRMIPASFPYTVTGDVTFYAKWQGIIPNGSGTSHYLSNIVLSAGQLSRSFSKNATSYKILLAEGQDSVTLTPIKEYDGATMTINKKAMPSYTVSLANGKSAKVTVKVAYGRKSKTYTFTVSRAKSTNNALSSLTSTAGAWSQPFDPNVLNYTLSLDENTKSAVLKAAAAMGKLAGVSPASSKVTLNNGQSKKVKITVKAQSGARRTYTITVTRAPSTNADLKSLKAGGLTPGFNPAQTSYNITLPSNKSSVTLSAGAVGYKAKVTIDGLKKSSKSIKLLNGQNVTVRIVVTSQAGNTKEYIISVTRQ